MSTIFSLRNQYIGLIRLQRTGRKHILCVVNVSVPINPRNRRERTAATSAKMIRSPSCNLMGFAERNRCIPPNRVRTFTKPRAERIRLALMGGDPVGVNS